MNKLQKEIMLYCNEHGTSVKQLGHNIGYKGKNSFMQVVRKEGRHKGMKIEKWLSLSTLLNKSIEELIELYGSEVE